MLLAKRSFWDSLKSDAESAVNEVENVLPSVASVGSAVKQTISVGEKIAPYLMDVAKRSFWDTLKNDAESAVDDVVNAAPSISSVGGAIEQGISTGEKVAKLFGRK